MIEKITTTEHSTTEATKINELIDAHNKLAEIFNAHYHEGAGPIATNYNTGPAMVPDEQEI